MGIRLDGVELGIRWDPDVERRKAKEWHWETTPRRLGISARDLLLRHDFLLQTPIYVNGILLKGGTA